MNSVGFGLDANGGNKGGNSEGCKLEHVVKNVRWYDAEFKC